MDDSRPSTTREVGATAAPLKHEGFFSRKKPSTNKIDEKGSNITTEVKPTVPGPPLISFSQLFRSVNLLRCFLDSILTLWPDTPQNLSSVSMLSVYLLLLLQEQLRWVQIPLVRGKFLMLFLAPDDAIFWETGATIRQLFRYSSKSRCRRCWSF